WVRSVGRSRWLGLSLVLAGAVSCSGDAVSTGQVGPTGAEPAGATPFVGGAAEVAAPEGAWNHYIVEGTDNAGRAHVEMWTRADEAVQRFTRDGNLLLDERCKGRIIESRRWDYQGAPEKMFSYKTVDVIDTAVRCMDNATHWLFATQRHVAKGELV